MMIDTELLLKYGGTHKMVSVGEVVFREGENCMFYHQLLEGKVSWSNFNADGREVLQELVAPGDSFGDLPLFDQQPYACTAIALTRCLIMRLPVKSFHTLLQENPEISLRFNRLLTHKLRFKLFLLRELATHSPEHTVEELFRYLSKNNNGVCTDCHRLLFTRQQIANLLGMRVETVIRATKNLQAKGKLDIVRGKVFLVPSAQAVCHNRTRQARPAEG